MALDIWHDALGKGTGLVPHLVFLEHGYRVLQQGLYSLFEGWRGGNDDCGFRGGAEGGFVRGGLAAHGGEGEGGVGIESCKGSHKGVE